MGNLLDLITHIQSRDEPIFAKGKLKPNGYFVRDGDHKIPQIMAGFDFNHLETQFRNQLNFVDHRIKSLYDAGHLLIISEYSAEPSSAINEIDINEIDIKRSPALKDGNKKLDLAFIQKQKNNINKINNINSESPEFFLENYNNLNILNVHLSGDGPPKTNGLPENRVEDFIRNSLKEINTVEGINVIIGDTNITPNKTYPNVPKKGNGNYKELAIEIATGLDNYFGNTEQNGHWYVVMSNYAVGKVRRGFIFLNDQVTKSSSASIKNLVGEENGAAELDGMIFAVRLKGNNYPDNLKKLSNLFSGKNVRIAHSRLRDYETDFKKFNESIVYTIDSLKFEHNINNVLSEKVFLDHAILSADLNNLCDILDQNTSNPPFYRPPALANETTGGKRKPTKSTKRRGGKKKSISKSKSKR